MKTSSTADASLFIISNQDENYKFRLCGEPSLVGSPGRESREIKILESKGYLGYTTYNDSTFVNNGAFARENSYLEARHGI